MRVLHVVADGSPGGGTTNVLALLEDLRSVGYHHDLHLATDAGSYAAQKGREIGAAVHELEFFGSRLSPRPAFSLRGIVGATQPDLVHVHGARAGFHFALASIGLHTPSVYTIRGYHFLRKPVVLRWLAATAERLSSQRTTATVHVCHYDSDIATRWKLVPRGRTRRVVYNGIDVADIPLATEPIGKRVAFLGRLTYQKDPQLIIEIARILASEGYTFDLIGGGDLESVVRASIVHSGLTETVTVHGSLPRDEALARMTQASVFLLPSRWEGLPIAPVEAMQMGIPVVAAAVSGIPEIIEDGVTGRLVADRSAESYATAVREVTQDLALRKALTDRARIRVASTFTRDRVVAEYADLYEQVVAAAS